MSIPSAAVVDETRSSPAAQQPARDRNSTFFVVYVGLAALVLAYLGTVRMTESLLGVDFQARVERAIAIDDLDRPVIQQMQERIAAAVHTSRWVRWGGLRVTTLVLASDGITWLYVDGHAERPPPVAIRPTEVLSEWADLLPAKARVTTTLPHNALLSNSILLAYAAVLLQVVYVANRRTSGRQSERLAQAVLDQQAAARRAAEIDAELAETRARLSEIEPIEREHSDEIEALQSEREDLQRKLSALAAREETLRGRAERAVDLAQEVRALEDLLEEATGDLEAKSDEIGRLESSLKKASKGAGKAQSGRAKTAEQLTRRFRTLYKTVEIDARAIEDIVALGDESLRLKAEEAVKRLADEADNVAVRRKVGGLPEHVQAFELGFAGKGRIYYTRGKGRRFRVLCVGAKNTQDADLDYLARMPRDTFG